MKIGRGRDNLPATNRPGGIISVAPSSVWKRIFTVVGTILTLAKLTRKSRCQPEREYSPSVTDLKPISSCIFTTSRIAACSISWNFSSEISFLSRAL